LRKLRQGKGRGKGKLRKETGTLPIFLPKQTKERGKIVSYLEHEGSLLNNNEDMLEHAVDFYKKLFGEEERSKIRLGDELW
jgi:hypothetical protein